MADRLMNNSSSTAFELRVLDGAQRGASTALRAGTPLTLSSDWRSDVVLRCADDTPVEVELRLADDAVELLPKAGSVRVDDVTVEAGTRVRVPLYRPIVINGTSVALGELGASEWGPLFGHAAPRVAAAVHALRRPWASWLATGGAALAAGSLSMLALAYVAAPQPLTAQQQAQRAQALLRSADIRTLTLRAEPDGTLVASGRLDDAAQLQRARELFAGQGIDARFDVALADDMAHAVREVYRLHGVAAEAKSVGPGMLRVQTSTVDLALLQRAKAHALRDVAGLKQLEVVNTAPPRASTPVAALDDPGKRIASIIAADPAYVVTSDGTRYFAGALLPTGHRIVHIAEREVHLELEGRASSLVF